MIKCRVRLYSWVIHFEIRYSILLPLQMNENPFDTADESVTFQQTSIILFKQLFHTFYLYRIKLLEVLKIRHTSSKNYYTSSGRSINARLARRYQQFQDNLWFISTLSAVRLAFRVKSYDIPTNACLTWVELDVEAVVQRNAVVWCYLTLGWMKNFRKRLKWSSAAGALTSY